MADADGSRWILAAMAGGALISALLAGRAAGEPQRFPAAHGPVRIDLPADRLPAPGAIRLWPGKALALVRSPAGGLAALNTRCPHLGCSLRWDRSRRRFVCPCHGAIFDQAGAALGGPAPAHLDRFGLRTRPRGGIQVNRAIHYAMVGRFPAPGDQYPASELLHIRNTKKSY
ncbi:MAG: ubiquinol-cytochrome c reductase iron-sulfur subunit [Acidobacteriota bacterium]